MAARSRDWRVSASAIRCSTASRSIQPRRSAEDSQFRSNRLERRCRDARSGAVFTRAQPPGYAVITSEAGPAVAARSARAAEYGGVAAQAGAHRRAQPAAFDLQ